jgi:hypothetical protein
MPAVIVALCGYKHSGKDTAADVLVEEYGFQKLAFADPLRESAAAMFGVKLPVHPDDKEKPTECGVSYRSALQGLGTDVMRNNGNNYMTPIGKRFWMKIQATRTQQWNIPLRTSFWSITKRAVER